MKLSEINWTILSTFLVVHVLTAIGLWAVPFSAELLSWTIGMYFIRWLGFTCAVHRYFSHRVCRTSRWFQFVLGLWGTLTMARSPIRFASGHRHHHLYSDTKRDLHSPSQQGLFRAYLGWVISKDYHEDNLGKVGDLKRYPELVYLNRYYFVPNLILLLLLYVTGGMEALVYGGLLSTIIVWHVAFSVTVLFHIVGKPTYETYDSSKNSIVLAILTCGEGWHNNHHANMSSACMSHEWWQPDIGYGVFVVLERLGLIWDLNRTRSAGIKYRLKDSNIAVNISATPARTVDKAA
jgi:stearoyl-CoA desaturase (Delta-9 desaturase)